MSEFVLYNGAYSGPQVDAAVSRALFGGALDQAIAALRAAVGSPLLAATAAAMTDTSKIYVYTGSEAGYVFGSWYYWNGNAWADGGAYNSAAADAAMSGSSTNAVQNKVINAAIEMSRISTEVGVEKITGNRLLVFESGYFPTGESGSVTDIDNPIAADTYACAVAPCVEGDVFRVYVRGGPVGHRGYCWLNDNKEQIAEGGKGVTVNTTLTAPANAAYLVLNNLLTYLPTGFYGYKNEQTARDYVDDISIMPIADSVTASNYATSEFADINASSRSTIVRYASDLTEEMVPNLPEYDRTWVIMTVRYSPRSVTEPVGRYSRLQLAWSAASNKGRRSLCYRVSFSQSSNAWGDWVWISNDDGERPSYVAIGPSITRGEIKNLGQSTIITDYRYPQYVGQVANMNVHNLAQGGTGLVSRFENGTRDNFMDVITANQALIATANLVTIEFGGNDRAILDGRVGSWDDYFDYDAALDQDDPYSYMKDNATEMGALNWCIKKIFDLNPRAVLVLLYGSSLVRFATYSADAETGKIVVTPEDSDLATWYREIHEQADILTKKLAIPRINFADDGNLCTVVNNAGNDATGIYGHDGIHLTNEGYLIRARYIAGQIAKILRH